LDRIEEALASMAMGDEGGEREREAVVRGYLKGGRK